MARDVLVRVHSKCLTGDVFHSARCDCGPQLDMRPCSGSAPKGGGAPVLEPGRARHRPGQQDPRLRAAGPGARHGRGQRALGFKPDQRDYGIGAQILRDLGVRTMRLLTNNPRKFVGLEGYGLAVLEWVPLEVPASEHTRKYLKTKKDKLGHRLKSV
jgi:3,4-dihydroxy 2-butanone 4-phosphate synthase / GTP cyclohydrolase II